MCCICFLLLYIDNQSSTENGERVTRKYKTDQYACIWIVLRFTFVQSSHSARMEILLFCKVSQRLLNGSAPDVYLPPLPSAFKALN